MRPRVSAAWRLLGSASRRIVAHSTCPRSAHRCIGAIPASLRTGITAGIGLFLAMIGLQAMGLVVNDDATLVAFGHPTSWEILLSLAGLLVMAGLEARGIRGSILITIMGLSLIGWATGLAEFGGFISAPPVASAAFSLDFSMVSSFAFLSVVFVLFFLDILRHHRNADQHR